MRVNATTKTWDNILSRVKEMNQEELQQLKEEIQIRNQNGKGLPAYGNLDEITFHCGMILTLLGQDMEDENLKDTPRRMARYLFEFLNYDPGNYETTFEAIQTDQLVIVKEVPFWSLCSHHGLPFLGEVSVGYLTGSKVIGLSKIPRIIQKHAHKLQLQERLAHEIADELEKVLVDAPGVGVFIKARHSCMSMRGIKSNGEMLTSVLRGSFRDEQSTKEEFLLLVK